MNPIISAFCALALSSSLYASQVHEEQSPDNPITHASVRLVLPDDQKLWHKTTMDFFAPILKPAAQKAFEALLTMTMPKSGVFDPINKQRRETTATSSFVKLQSMGTEKEQVDYILGLKNRHAKYVGKSENL